MKFRRVLVRMMCVTAAILLSLPMVGQAQEQNGSEHTWFATTPDTMYRRYDVLHIRKKGKSGVKAINPDTGNVVLQTGSDRRLPSEVIQWALSNAQVTAVVNDDVPVRNTVKIPTDYTTLIIGPEAG